MLSKQPPRREVSRLHQVPRDWQQEQLDLLVGGVTLLYNAQMLACGVDEPTKEAFLRLEEVHQAVTAGTYQPAAADAAADSASEAAAEAAGTGVEAGPSAPAAVGAAAGAPALPAAGAAAAAAAAEAASIGVDS